MSQQNNTIEYFDIDLEEEWDGFRAMLPVEMLDDLLHTDEDPFCPDLTCPCHYEAEYQAAVTGFSLA